MILQAFSQVLHQERRKTGLSAEEILHSWLLRILSDKTPQDHVGKVIHTEIAILTRNREVHFVGRSKTGENLLNSLYLYCESYERWQFGRWIHQLKPHFFNQLSS